MDNTEHSLFELMAAYDYENTGTIQVQDLIRAFKKLGLLHPEPHISILLSAGGAKEGDEKIDYVVYT